MYSDPTPTWLIALLSPNGHAGVWGAERAITPAAALRGYVERVMRDHGSITRARLASGDPARFIVAAQAPGGNSCAVDLLSACVLTVTVQQQPTITIEP